MQPVRPDDQIEVARHTAVERHVHAPVGLFEMRDRVAEPRLDAICDPFVDERRQIAAPQAGEAAVRRACKGFHRKAGHSPSSLIHDADFTDVVFAAPDVCQ